jgi:hypothetical protein
MLQTVTLFYIHCALEALDLAGKGLTAFSVLFLFLYLFIHLIYRVKMSVKISKIDVSSFLIMNWHSRPYGMNVYLCREEINMQWYIKYTTNNTYTTVYLWVNHMINWTEHNFWLKGLPDKVNQSGQFRRYPFNQGHGIVYFYWFHDLFTMGAALLTIDSAPIVKRQH